MHLAAGPERGESGAAGISEEALASYLSNLYERIAESVQDSDVARRRTLAKKVEAVTEAARKAVAAAYTELSEELLERGAPRAECRWCTRQT